MCTAVTFSASEDFFMGRTLDYECSFGEQAVVLPRRFPLPLCHGGTLTQHYALVGAACVSGGYPLYYDAVNEMGLGMAGLNFAGNACYAEPMPDRQNIAQYEFIPWLLGTCANLAQACAALAALNLTGAPFSADYPAAELHWLVADRTGALVVEAAADGLHVYDDPAGVLTNNPPFPQQLFQLNNYRALSPRQPENRFAPALPLELYSRGMGALGLPGDLSSMSRFVRAAFTRANAAPEGGAEQVFHILETVSQTKGCCEVRPGVQEYTLYTACWDASRGIYYYTTYENRQLSAVELRREGLDTDMLRCYPMHAPGAVCFRN